MFYDVTIASTVRPLSPRLIANIKALREMTREPTHSQSLQAGDYIGLTTAKALIEACYEHGRAILRLTPRQYAHFNYNLSREETTIYYDWWIEKVEPFWPTPAANVFTF